MRKLISGIIVLLLISGGIAYSQNDDFVPIHGERIEGYVLHSAEYDTYPAVLNQSDDTEQAIAFIVEFDENNNVIAGNMFLMDLYESKRIENSTIDIKNSNLQMGWSPEVPDIFVIIPEDDVYPCLILEFYRDNAGIGYMEGFGGYSTDNWNSMREVLFTQFYYDGKLTGWDMSY